MSLLCAAAAVASAAFAMPVSSDAADGLEARAHDAGVSDLIARFDFDEATSLLARAVTDMLSARTDHKSEVDSKTDHMHENIAKGADRGAHLDQLRHNTDDLAKSTQGIGKGANHVRKKGRSLEQDTNGPPKYRLKDARKPSRLHKYPPGPSGLRRRRELDIW
ncbi:uncharacterized protein B0H18DRAFT_1119895 [Fomitopsis serialis]|uniref:uncharacterized protein n=1 Tax=Fomitopsis serialis TaxID=139415 RepID=UPI002007582E|nr:uncharacterized protein B0H18DRAFT_1119895 [Neoantrodia serialis]KAH9924564.1 hypothetical protein B0H18DRAFT_1119895 [Neoantrodia serialis]